MYYYDYFPFSALGLISFVVIISGISVCAIGVHYVSLAIIFQKANVASWKSLIPFYNIYILFKLAWSAKAFIIYVIAFIGLFVGVLMAAPEILTEYSYNYIQLLTGEIITVVFLIVVLVWYILLSVKLSCAFTKNGGFAVGLILFPLVFRAILAFGHAEYVLNEKEIINTEKTGCIRFYSGDIKGASIIMEHNDTAIIGRDPEYASIIVDRNNPNSKISRIHCSVEYDGKKDVFYIVDLSSNGTYLEDGTKLQKSVKTAVKSGQGVKLPKDILFKVV